MARLERRRESILEGVRKGYEHAHLLLRGTVPKHPTSSMDGREAALLVRNICFQPGRLPDESGWGVGVVRGRVGEGWLVKCLWYPLIVWGTSASLARSLALAVHLLPSSFFRQGEARRGKKRTRGVILDRCYQYVTD